MKMKLVKRIAIMTSAGIGMIGVVLMLLETFGIQCFSALNKLAFHADGVRFLGLILALIIICALAALHAYAFYIAFMGERAYKARMITLKGDKDDVVLIKQETLDDFVKSVVGEPEGVTDLTVNTKYQDMKLGVMVEMNVDIDTDIKDATSKIQADIRRQLEEVNGIEMSGVSILVAKINVPQLSDGMSMPWAAKSEDALEAPAEENTAEAAQAAETEQAYAQEPSEENDDPFDADEAVYVPAPAEDADDELFAPVSIPQEDEKAKEE